MAAAPPPAEVAASHPLRSQLRPLPVSLRPCSPVSARCGPLPVLPARLWPHRQAGAAFQVACGLSIMAGSFPAPLGLIWALSALGEPPFFFGYPLLCQGPKGCVPILVHEPLKSACAGLAPAMAPRPLKKKQVTQRRRGVKNHLYNSKFSECFQSRHTLSKCFRSP